ncbi:hypothetical protein [Nocardiopsis aegyptia]|uniref:Uncharacterized protein n=1 Tax=Nocardiopsis aegyptia TaxID=220378 RepID=A0A7Z0JEB2_9ACTN|nr:hypothetical protein [Nocardiopsis aegyptia]NYJ38239.1 hypothetical protein [Nocardiopsis aegyptia]
MALETAAERAAPRWIAIGVALALIALVTAGWSLANAAIPGTSPVSSGQELDLGGDGTTRAVLVLADDGWGVDVSASHPGQSYRLERASAVLDVVRPEDWEADQPDMAQRWQGARGILLSEDLSTEVGEPGPVASADGTEGWAAHVSRSRGPGTMVVLPAPSSGYAVRLLLQGTDGGPGVTSEQLAHMVTFSEEGVHG